MGNGKSSGWDPDDGGGDLKRLGACLRRPGVNKNKQSDYEKAVAPSPRGAR